LTDPDADPANEPAEPQFVKRPGPFAPDEREQVIVLIKRGVARNEIARRTGRDGSTITRVAQVAGLAFDRGRVTAPARAAAASDLSLRRLAIGAKMADHLERLVDELHKPLTIRRINTRTGASEIVKLPQPDPAMKRDLAIAAGILADKLGHILTVNAPQEGRAAIIGLFESLKLTVAAEDAAAAKYQIIDQGPRE
jgi:hypothetical protein